MLSRFTAAIAIALFAVQATQANPLARTTPSLVRTAVDGASVAGSFPVKSIDSDSVTVHPNISHPLSTRNPRLAARQEFPADLLTCLGSNCVDDCFETSLADLEFDECFSLPSYVSAAIIQPSGQGLPFAVLVGLPGCESFAQIPEVNTCFNLNGGVFSDFAVEP